MLDPITDDFTHNVQDALRIGREMKRLVALRDSVPHLSSAWLKYTTGILMLKAKERKTGFDPLNDRADSYQAHILNLCLEAGIPEDRLNVPFNQLASLLIAKKAERRSPCGELLSAGWKFDYDPSTWYISARHPLGGAQSVCEVIAPARGGFSQDGIGFAIAAFLNGEQRGYSAEADYLFAVLESVQLRLNKDCLNELPEVEELLDDVNAAMEKVKHANSTSTN